MVTVQQPTIDFTQIATLHRFSTADYLEMIEKGVLGRNDRVELIGGMIVNMSPQGSRHNQFLMQINRLFSPLWDTAIISIQGTLTVAEGQVYDPDVLLLRRRPEGYKEKLPDAADVLLVIEAADSSFVRDQQIKLPVYAAAGIPEYWIADLEREVIIVHREPNETGYRVIEIRQGADTVSPSVAPRLSFAVREAFE